MRRHANLLPSDVRGIHHRYAVGGSNNSRGDQMTTEEIRNARNSFAAQLTGMIRDFEHQTGATIRSINVERDHSKRYYTDQASGQLKSATSNLFKGVYLAIE